MSISRDIEMWMCKVSRKLHNLCVISYRVCISDIEKWAKIITYVPHPGLQRIPLCYYTLSEKVKDQRLISFK